MTTRLPLPSTAISRPLRLLVMLTAALLFAAVRPALSHAVVHTVGGASFGVQPETLVTPVAPLTPVDYNGGPVVHSSAPYAIFWDPQTTLGGYEYVTQHYIESFSDESGALDNVFAVTSQYGDGTGKAADSATFRGAYTDTDAFPSSGNCAEGTTCLTDAQLRAELAKVITSLGLPTGVNPAGGPTPTYFIFTPASVTVCLQGSGGSGNCSKEGGSGEPLCSYHSFTSVNAATVLYAVEPFTTRTGCQDGTGEIQEPNAEFYSEDLLAPRVNVLVNNIAAEEVAMATDPMLNGWHETNGAHDEVPDKCRNEFHGGLFQPAAPEDFNQTIGGVTYYVNDEYDQAALYDGYPARPCLNEVKDEPKFTSTSPIRSGDPVTFNATSSYVDLGIDKYNWSFGDGASTEVNCGGRTPTYGVAPDECTASSGAGNPNPVASVAHTYTYAGEYEVTLTVTDGGGNVASTAHVIDVSGTPAPSPGNNEGGGSSAPSTTSGAAPSTTPAPASTVTPLAPGKVVAATQSVSSRSLSSALKEGIVVHYSVSEQVAGRFEVLLPSSIARRIGLRGTTATGLAKGTPAQTVIAKAILVTTKGGRSTYKIKFSKATATKLRKLRKVTLMVRLVVHNASSATATTVLDTVNLR